jgi:hypothetical protein
MWSMTRALARTATLLVVCAIGFAGCVYSTKETEKVTPNPSAVVMQSPQRVYNYPEGRYELQGNGTASSPYYWVWIPAGARSVPPPPPLPPISSK